MIEFYNVVDVTPGGMTANASLTSWRGGRKLHCFTCPTVAKRRRTQLANVHPDKQFGVLKTTISESGIVETEWITDVTFVVPGVKK